MELKVGVEVPFLDKVADYVASGIGGAAGPFLVAWKASKDAEAKRITARAEAETLRILAEGHSDALEIVAKATADTRELLSGPQTEFQTQITLGEMVVQKIQFQEEKRLANQLSVVKRSIEGDVDRVVTDHEPDHDWTARFFNYIQDVSSEEMQILWARVLAGEVQWPGETSLRTLSILRNLDSRTAALFRTLCSACVSPRVEGSGYVDARVPSLQGDPATNSLQEFGLNFDSLNVLNEHGLIISDYNSWMDYKFCVGFTVGPQVHQIPFRYQGHDWVLNPIHQGAIDQEFRLSGVALTRSGRELSRVVDLQTMEQYTQALKAYFESRNMQMTEVNKSDHSE